MDKDVLAALGLVCLTTYGCLALILGFDGTVATAVIAGIVGIIGGVYGYMKGKGSTD